ncbi:spike base protein, RCAP_Rcc01079 family [Pyruvatibacter mobilis]|jgi:hypothetical protein|uniref:spike base protein, RCAP_Rcc01079 family n=1 Tax=Pyruvatibacter mobilis TaxID=1712261 RepID=UPI003BAD3740
MTDKFKGVATGLTSPADTAFAVVPSNDTDLPTVTRGLYVGVSGDISLVMRDGSEAVLANVQAGSALALRIRRVKATGTTAQNLVGLA